MSIQLLEDKIKHLKAVHIYGFLVVLAVLLIFFANPIRNPHSKDSLNPSQDKQPSETINDVNLAWESDGAKVPLNEIFDGCPGQDCIPAINHPQFDSNNAANTWLQPDDRVFVLSRTGVTKIYPQRILNWHEIVNDWFENEPIAITFCPLCGSSVAFVRQVNGTTTQFGVSGKLHQNDLVMYDRLEGSLWQQITGEAIVGPAARRNEELAPILLSVSTWKEAQSKHPEALVLSKDTGFNRDYDTYPYGSYESNSQIGVAPQRVDDRLHPKSWVYGVRIGDTAVAFLEDDLFAKSTLDYQANGLNLSISVDQTVNITDNLSGERIVPLRLFWFAWAAFNPDTLVYAP